MKRFLALALLVGASAFGLAGCGEETKAPETPAKPAGEAPATPPADAKPADAPK